MKSFQPPTIGILGGVGAIASARFHLQLVEAWARTHDAETDDNFLSIVHISQSLRLSGRGVIDRSVTQARVNILLKRLEMLDRVAIICNSITPLLPSDPRLLTPVASCAVALQNVKKAWLLASESSVTDRVYQDAYPHIEWLVPVHPITPAIQHLVATGSYDRRWTQQLELDIPDNDVIVLGCTELSTQPSPFLWHNVISPTDEMIKVLCS